MNFSFSQKNSQKDPQEESEHIIEKAKRKSEDLLTQSVKEAELIISQTESFRDDLQKSLREDVAFQAQQFSQKYQELLPELKEYYHKGIDEQLQTFKTSLNELTLELSKSLKEQVNQIHEILKDQAQKELNVIQEQIQEYKKQKLTAIDQTVKEIVKKASLKILGKAISTSDHEKLIINSLEQAKKEGIFEI